jgi:hypothetical protein
MCVVFAPNFGDKGIGCFITTSHRLTLFTREFFYQKQHDCHPHPPDSPVLPPQQLFCLSGGKVTLLTQKRWLRQNRRQCWTPSQNTASKIHLINGRSTGKGAYARKGTALRVTSRFRVIFLTKWQYQSRKLWKPLIFFFCVSVFIVKELLN